MAEEKRRDLAFETDRAEPALFSDEDSPAEDIGGNTLPPWEESRIYQSVAWYDELNRIGAHWVADAPGNEAVRQAQTRQCRVYVEIAVQAIGREKILAYVRRDPGAYDELRNKTVELLMSDVRTYRPEKGSLGSRVSSQVGNRIHDAYTKYFKPRMAYQGPSLDTPVGGDDETQATLLELTAAEQPEPYQTAALREAAGAMVFSMMSVILHFKETQSRQRGTSTRMIHYRLAYTEQLTCFASQGGLACMLSGNLDGQNVIKALDGDYLSAFSVGTGSGKLTLRSLARVIPKRRCDYFQEDPAEARNQAKLDWKDGFFEAKVPMYYLRRMARQPEQKPIAASSGEISRYRGEYRQDVIHFLEGCGYDRSILFET